MAKTQAPRTRKEALDMLSSIRQSLKTKQEHLKKVEKVIHFRLKVGQVGIDHRKSTMENPYHKPKTTSRTQRVLNKRDRLMKEIRELTEAAGRCLGIMKEEDSDGD